MSDPESAPQPTAPPAPSPPRSALADFGRSLGALTPRGFVTEALIVVNVLVYAAMVARGVDPMNPKIADLLAWGADYGPRTTHGEWWRLFTATFLHIGAIHLAMNMYVLWQAGRLVERILGNAGFALLYVASGLVGSLASAAWSPYIVSAGASGAVFGVYGGLLGFLVRERASIPRQALEGLQRSAIFFIGYNLLYGLRDSGIDMAAHVGGLAGGFLGGLFLAHPLTPEGAAKRGARNVAFAALAALAIAAGAKALPTRVDLVAELESFSAVESRSLDAFNGAIRDVKAKKLDDLGIADVIDTKVLPEWHASRERLAAIHGLPAKQSEHLTAVLAYASAREEAFRLFSEGARAHDEALIQKANEKQAEAGRLAKQLGEKK